MRKTDPDIESEYVGERATRRPAAAAALALLSPGSALAYVGELRGALLINAASVAAWVGFFAVWAHRPFPLAIPFWGFAAGWLVCLAAAAWDAARRAASVREQYVLRDVNHPFVYFAIALFSFVVPLAGLAVLAERHLVTIVRVDTNDMFPNVIAGDTVVVDRRVSGSHAPRSGELVAFRAPSGDIAVSRVIAGPESTVVATTDLLFVDDKPVLRLQAAERDAARLEALSGPAPDGFGQYVEQLGDATFAVVAPRRSFGLAPDTIEVGPGQLAVLNDDRSTRRDSRTFGAIDGTALVGRPLFLARPSRGGGEAVSLVAAALGPVDRDSQPRDGLRIQPIALDSE
ncbi:MAG: signal peptidase I [Myxococcales bacterium]|nr:signal peptidase I [Myxococcales bacterium]MCB9530490.1 signal peptidase I [Myxococcales bacterium]MCB9533442.1 signal peptidase I [Myxococcales bacterium]